MTYGQCTRELLFPKSSYGHDDDISVENKSPQDTQITINDINIVEQMNTAQINTDPETGDEITTHNESMTTSMARNSRYNLRPRPTKKNVKYTMVQDRQQSADIIMPMPHARVVLTQMNVCKGIKKFDEKGNEALLKELNQLHQQDAAYYEN